VERYQRALTILTMRLEVTPDVAHLACETRAARDRIRRLRDEAEEAVARRIAATHVLYHTDDTIDRAVCSLADELREALGASDPIYQRVFIQPPDQAMSGRATLA
jgi:hypothetical protein